MNKEFRGNIILFIFCIFLGFVLCVQIKQNFQDYQLVSLKSIQMVKNQIEGVENDIADMKALIQNKKEVLNKMKHIKNDKEDIYDILNEQLQDMKSIAGFTNMEGTGVIIKMEDSKDETNISDDSDLIHDSYVLNILNDLKIAGAEAISINEHRITSTSEVKCGGPIIRVNGKSLGSPFIIKAIGDPKLLYASINAPGTYGYALKNVFNITIQCTVEDKVQVPSYKYEVNYKYAKPIKEGD